MRFASFSACSYPSDVKQPHERLAYSIFFEKMLYETSDQRYKALTADSAKLIEDVMYNEAYIRREQHTRVRALRSRMRLGGEVGTILMHMV